MEVAILKCLPNTQFHLGKSSLENSFHVIHSDTLFSAIITVFNQVYPDDVDDLVGAFKNGDIKISSAFHCLEYNSNEYLFFLPKPQKYHYVGGTKIKESKKIKYFSVGVWNQAPHPDDLLEGPRALIGGTHLVTDEELERLGIKPPNGSSKREQLNKRLQEVKFVKEVIYPKVRVHADSQTDVFYHQVNVQLQALDFWGKASRQKNQTHFYFLLEYRSATPFADRVKQIIRLLADEGIGGERSTGCGSFEYVTFKSANEMGFPKRQNEASQCSLSLNDSQRLF